MERTSKPGAFVDFRLNFFFFIERKKEINHNNNNNNSTLRSYAPFIELTQVHLHQSRILRPVLPFRLEITPIPVEIEPTAIFCICLQLHLLQSRPRVCQRPHANC